MPGLPGPAVASNVGASSFDIRQIAGLADTENCKSPTQGAAFKFFFYPCALPLRRRFRDREVMGSLPAIVAAGASALPP